MFPNNFFLKTHKCDVKFKVEINVHKLIFPQYNAYSGAKKFLIYYMQTSPEILELRQTEYLQYLEILNKKIVVCTKIINFFKVKKTL
jgi:hypothetical protein